MANCDYEKLRGICREIRIDIIEMLAKAGSGHPGGSLSAVEIIVSLYFCKMRHKPDNPSWQERDRFVISKGHGVPALYAVLSKCGYFPHEELSTLRKLNSRLQGHPDRTALPGLEASTGSLGQGLAIAQGMALASKLDGDKFRVYCLIGDGESQEGQIWETAMSCPKYKLDNLTVILDYNKGQIDGFVKDVMNIEPVKEKWKAFNWNVVEIDGNNIEEVVNALDSAEKVKGKPTIIIANTVKGKFVSFMENKCEWHGAAPNEEQCKQALEELRKA